MDGTYSIKDYLQGKIRGFEVSDTALQAICIDAGISDIGTSLIELSSRQKDLATAYAYLWLANGPASTSKWSEKDGDWSQSGGGDQLTAEQIRTYIRLANAIFEEYDLPTVGKNSYKVRYGGFRNIRSYGRNRR